VRSRTRRDERGAALALAIVFLVVIGALTGALLSSLASSLHNRVTLDQVRDREYAADGAIQDAIAQIRAIPASSTYAGPGQSPCGPFTHTLNSVTIHVDCIGAPAVTRDLYLQRNVIFTTCLDSDKSSGRCPESKVIIRAQVNFQATGSYASLQIQRTWVQAWSVNR
jgi:Tfp pilus assembly protein PilX